MADSTITREAVARAIADELGCEFDARPRIGFCEELTQDDFLRAATRVLGLVQTPDPRVDTQVWSAARSLDEGQVTQPEWLWFAKEDTEGIPIASYSYGRWAKLPGQTPYVRADIALGIPSLATGGARG